LVKVILAVISIALIVGILGGMVIWMCVEFRRWSEPHKALGFRLRRLRMDVTELISRCLANRESVLNLVQTMEATVEALPPDTDPEGVEPIELVISVLKDQSSLVTDLVQLCADLNDEIEKLRN
jgi:hypothetical protein